MSDEKSEAQAQLAKMCKATDVRPGHLYRHHKGGEYIVFAVTLDEENLVPEIHYFSLEHRTRWSRELTVFIQVMGARSETVHRFERIRAASFEEIAAAIGVSLTVDYGIMIYGGKPEAR